MKIKLLLAIVLFFGVVQGQDNAEQKPPPRITNFVKSENRVSKNMVFLFDCSTSMGKENRFDTAIAEVNTILRQPLDDGMFSLLTFGSFAHEINVWPGLSYEDDPKPAPPGWAKLPDAFAATSANDFLNSISCEGFTDIGSGIEEAFELNANREKVTIIIFTDGNNTHPGFRGKRPTQVVAKIKALQKDRTDRKKDQILIFCFGLSAEQNVVMLSAIAKAGHGGYLTADKVCAKCKANKADKPEVQQIHRARHIILGQPGYNSNLQGFENEEDHQLEETPNIPGPHGPLPR